MPEPAIRRDDFWADAINSLLLRPVYRKPFPSPAPVKRQEASGEDVPTEAMASSSESGLPKSDHAKAEELGASLAAFLVAHPETTNEIRETIGEIKGRYVRPASVKAVGVDPLRKVGQSYLGKVTRTTTFGAFISLPSGKDGLLHISELKKLTNGKRVDNVDHVLSVGQKIQVEITKIDDRGNVSLSPVVTQEPATVQEEAEERIQHAATDFNTDFR